MLGAWAVALPRRDRRVFLAAWAAFALGSTASREAFQRYYEPFALMMLVLCAARVKGAGKKEKARPWAAVGPAAGPVALAVVLAVLTVRGVCRPMDLEREAAPGSEASAKAFSPQAPPRGRPLRMDGATHRAAVASPVPRCVCRRAEPGAT